MSDEYVHVGDHAEVLESGRNIGPGDRVAPDELHERDQYLLDEGRLVPDVVEEMASNTPANAPLSGESLAERARQLNIEGRSTMSRHELRAAVAEASTADNADDSEGGDS